MNKEKKHKLIVLIICLITFLWPIITLLTHEKGGTPQERIVPLSGMQFELHIVVFYIILPQVLSTLFVVVFPLTVLPLFLMIKRKVWYKFKDAYVDMGDLVFSLKIYVKRGV